MRIAVAFTILAGLLVPAHAADLSLFSAEYDDRGVRFVCSIEGDNRIVVTVQNRSSVDRRGCRWHCVVRKEPLPSHPHLRPGNQRFYTTPFNLRAGGRRSSNTRIPFFRLHSPVLAAGCSRP